MLRHPIAITSDERGQTAVEYAVVMLFVALVLAFAFAAGASGLLDDVGDKVTAVMSS